MLSRFVERVARAVYEYESAVNDEDGEWVIVEETKKSQRDPVPGVLRVDMREYTEFDESLDQRYWSDETDWGVASSGRVGIGVGVCGVDRGGQ